MADFLHPDSVWIYYFTKADMVAAVSKSIFQRPLTDKEYARLIDARTSEIVRICISCFECSPGFFLPMIRVRLLRAIRVGGLTGSSKVEYAITHDGSKPQLLLLNFRVPQEAQKKGLATHMFATQVHAAQAFGFTSIHAYAAGGIDSEAWDTRNGYDTLPRLGFDKRLTASEKAHLPPKLRYLTFLHEIMEQPGGRECWLKHGFALEVLFDTSQHSRSMQRLHAALSALSHKHGYWDSGQDMPLRVERGQSLQPRWDWQQRVWEYRKAKSDLRYLLDSRAKETRGSRLEVSDTNIV